MKDGIQTIRRMLQILYAVAGAEDGKTIHQISKDVGLKPNTVYKFVRTLEMEGVLTRRTRPIRFNLGKTLSELKQLDNERHLLTIAGKVLIRAQAKLPTANFVFQELYENEIFERLCIASRRPGYVVKQRDYRLNFYSKAGTLLFLAYATPDLRNELYRLHKFENEGRKIWENLEKLENYLENIRRKGYSMPNFVDETQSYRVAVPLFSPTNGLIAAVGAYIPCIEGEKNKRPLLQLSLTAASEIHRLMGKGKYW